MNILVTGANGQLGSELRIVSAASPDKYIFTDVNDVPGVETEKLDITDPEAIRAMVRSRQIDAIVNCAAYTNVDAAEDNYELAHLLNATAVGHLASAMQETGGLLVHISTDYVFGGDPYNTPCREDQKGTPTGVYGLTKLQGEEAVLKSGCRHLIIRTGWLYSEFGKNFVKTIFSSRPRVRSSRSFSTRPERPRMRTTWPVRSARFCPTGAMRAAKASTTTATKESAAGSTLPGRLPRSQAIRIASSVLATAMSSRARYADRPIPCSTRHGSKRLSALPFRTGWIP